MLSSHVEILFSFSYHFSVWYFNRNWCFPADSVISHSKTKHDGKSTSSLIGLFMLTMNL